MAKVLIHATVSVDGFMADVDGGVDWMTGFPVVRADEELVAGVVEELGAVIFGSHGAQPVEDGEVPYGGSAGVPMFAMTHTAHEPIEKDGITYTFVVDDIAKAVESATQAAGDKWVSIVGGSVARQCLERGLVDEIQLHVVPIIRGDGVPLFTGLSRSVGLERVQTAAFAGENHLRYRVVAGAPPVLGS